MIADSNLNNKVRSNFITVKFSYLIPSLLILLTCYFLYLFLSNGGNYITKYIGIQQDLFFYLNSKLSAFPNIQYNLTQLGDVIILFPFVSIFALYSPKLWEAIITSSLLSLLVSALLKNLFKMPRPAAFLNNDNFTIIGKTLTGHTSLPSGHSMTTFIVITLVLFAFMPQKWWKKTAWVFTMITLGFIITFSRVGVGAHYPLDVIIGSTIGYILAIIGIKINSTLNWSDKLRIKKRFLILMIILVVWMGLIIQKIIKINLFIYNISLVTLIITLYFTYKTYVQKRS